jgi:1-acyl-sn-glycerol-3-phosphate acyltransferase
MLRWIATRLIRASGWTAVGGIPDVPRAVLIAAPHTSNWDGFWLLVYKISMEADVRFLAKHTLFWWPLGPILIALGAFPIDRDDPAAIVSQLIAAFKKEDQLFLALAPEGTRKWMPYWKTGFYRIAEVAGVPIVLAFIDYKTKRMGIGKTLPLGQSEQETLDELRSFYTPLVGARPALQSPIKFPPE